MFNHCISGAFLDTAGSPLKILGYADVDQETSFTAYM